MKEEEDFFKPMSEKSDIDSGGANVHPGSQSEKTSKRSPTKGQKMTPKFTRFSLDEEPAHRKSSNSPYGKVLKPVYSQHFYEIKI